MAIFSAIAYGLAYAGGFLAATAGFSLSTSVAIGKAVSLVGSALVSSGIQRLLAPKISIPQSEVQAVISQTSGPRRIYVGQNLTGGIRAFFDVKNGILYQLVLVAHGKVSQFVEFWIDGIPVVTDVLGNVTEGSKAGFVTCEVRDGLGSGGNYSDLLGNFTRWDASRALTGQATFMAAMKAPDGNDFSKVFPKAYNTSLQWVIKGQEIYDPRSSGSYYNDNAALVIAHYLRHEEGYNLSTGDVDWDSVMAMADVSDTAIPQLGGGTAPNLRLWGHWTLDESPASVLDRMHASSGIRAYEKQDGRLGLIGGPFGTPACTITAKDIKQIKTSSATSEREGYNILRIFHLDASQKYEVTEVDAWEDAARVAVEGEISKEYRMEMCPNRSQARRLGKEQIHDDNCAKVQIITNLVGLKARFPKEDGQRHTILLDYRPEDGSGRVIQGEYEVTDHDFDPQECECLISLARVDRASQEWTAAEEGAPPTPLPDPEENYAPPITAVLTQRVIQLSAGVRQAVLDVDAVPIAGRDDVKLQARYKAVGDFVWTDMQATGFSATSGAVQDGGTYQAEARFNGVFDEPDTWESLGSITIQIDGTAPGQPTELFVSNGSGLVNLNWRNPSSDFFAVRIYRSTGTVFSSATLIGQTGGNSGQISEFQDDTISAATEYNYWVAAVNVSGVEGAPAGPANITTP